MAWGEVFKCTNKFFQTVRLQTCQFGDYLQRLM